MRICCIQKTVHVMLYNLNSESNEKAGRAHRYGSVFERSLSLGTTGDLIMEYRVYKWVDMKIQSHPEPNKEHMT